LELSRCIFLFSPKWVTVGCWLSSHLLLFSKEKNLLKEKRQLCIRIHMHTNTHAHLWLRTTRQSTAAETHNLCTNMHTHTYTHAYTCKRVHIRINMHIHTYIHVCTHTYTHRNTHTYNMYICTRANTPGTTGRQRLREEPDLMPRSSAILLHSTQSTIFGTSNARTSLYPLPETQIPLNPTIPLPNIPPLRVLKDLRWWICHHSSVEKSAGLNKLGLSEGPRFDSGRKLVNSNQYGFEQIDPQARILNYCFQ